MSTRIQFPQWRAENENTRYPFSDVALLRNSNGRTLLEGTFLDASLYVIGADTGGLYLSSVVVTHTDVTLNVGTVAHPDLASGSFDLVNPPDLVSLEDEFGRPAGLLVSESQRLAAFQSWGVGTHRFTIAQTEFAATTIIPTQETGVRAIRLETGEVFTGDVWLVGDDGVVLRPDDIILPATCGQAAVNVKTIRVDVVGDSLFRRRLCQTDAGDLFATPRLVRRLRVIGPNQTFDMIPDAFGNVQLAAASDLAADTVLRIAAVADGVRIGAAGASPAS